MIKSKQFHLPGKKVLQPSDTVIEIVLVDATEQPVERPKKDNAYYIIQGDAKHFRPVFSINRMDNALLLHADFILKK